MSSRMSRVNFSCPLHSLAKNRAESASLCAILRFSHSKLEKRRLRMKSSAINKPDERLVYLALRSVFIGEDAKIRTMKTIRKQVQKHQQKEDVKALMNNHNEDHVYSTAKELLEDHVFESTVRAKLRFPEVFSISPAQSADREQSEEEAAKSRRSHG